MRNVLSSMMIIMLLICNIPKGNCANLKQVKDNKLSVYESNLIDEKSIDHVGGVDMSDLKWDVVKVDENEAKKVDPVTKNNNCDQYFSKWCALTCNFKFSKNQQFCSLNETSGESTCCCAFEKGFNKCAKLVKK